MRGLWPFRTIRGWLIGSYLVLSLVAVGISGLLTLGLLRAYSLHQERAVLEANAEAVARQARMWMEPVPWREGLARLAYATAFLGNARVRILDAEGQVLVDSGPPARAGAAFWAAPSPSMTPGAGESMPGASLYLPGATERLERPHGPPGMRWMRIRQFRSPWGSRFHFETFPAGGEAGGIPPEAEDSAQSLIVRAPIGEPQDPLGYVELQTGVEPSVEVIAAATRAFTIAGLGAALLAGLLGLMVSEALSRPIRRLARAAIRMGEGDLGVRAPESGPLELRHLAGELNRMAERLQATFNALARERDALRHFIADASHQLRTPLTALRTFLELLQGPAAEDPEARTAFLTESQAQVDRMAWITQNLLDLSRLEGGLIQLDLAPHPLADVIRAAAALFKEAAARKGLTLELELPEEPVEVVWDRWRVEMALSNLLDNAVKFTPSGGRITVGSRREGEKIRVWVEDTGPGIDPEDLPHVFERFYRGRNATAEGSGLGLAIVRWIVEIHGGRVEVHSRPGQGSRFELTLPLRAEAVST
ncbi:HAMP domain-containing sensor histidine kinase [Thermoflexus sp.]|uniref:sensor histidine kinase n=1 Tax=Thermoflexus sp. TaxID=1969742 RepID=UPI002ADE6680|nr:HAMP domain-containing sensor histidine kinase [Thermoflexus sp.]